MGQWGYAKSLRRPRRDEEKPSVNQFTYRTDRKNPAHAGRALAVHGADLHNIEIEQAYSNKKKAEESEALFSEHAAPRHEISGREFFWCIQNDHMTIFGILPGMADFLDS